MKKVITSLVLTTSLVTASAGDYLTNTNQHVAFLRNLARNSTTDLDAVYSNPAGMAFFKDGWQLSLNLQSATQTRTITSTFAPFAGNADGLSPKGIRTFEGKAFAPVIPSVMAAYKTGRWAFGANFALVGGGGKATFEDGLPSFEAPVSLIPALLSAGGIQASQYKYDTYMQGRQYIFGLTLGAAYRVSNRLSAYLGLRANYVNNHYEGYLRNISANIGGQMLPLQQTLTAMAGRPGVPASMAQRLRSYANATADKELNVDQTGWGLTPIVGVNYRLGDLHLAAKYEFRTSLRIQNDTKENSTGVSAFDKGVNTPHDIPAMLSLGATYHALDILRLSVGYHHFYDRKAGMSGDRQRFITHGTDEVLAGIEVDVTSRLLLSAGGQITNYGLSDAFQQDLSFSCDSFSLGVGGAYKLSNKLKLNVAYFYTKYSDYTKRSDSYAPSAGRAIPGQDVYNRTNHVLGLGLDIAL